MKTRLFSLAVCLFLALKVSAADSNYSQVYTILINGIPAGTEKVSEEQSKEGNLIASSESEIFMLVGVETKRMAFATRTVLAKATFAPVHYSFKFTAGDSRDWYEVTVNDRSITRVLNRGGQASEVSAPFLPGGVILDFSAYHHYEHLIRKYDAKKGGRQSFQNFVPIIGSSIPLTVTEFENTDVEHPRGKIRARNFKVDLAGGVRTRTVQVDKAGRLLRVWVPEQNLEVLRADLVPESTLELAKPATEPPPPPKPPNEE